MTKPLLAQPAVTHLGNPNSDELQWYHLADGNISFDEWQWQQGVALFALIKSYLALGERRYLDFVKDWVDSHLSQGKPAKSINT